MVLFSACIYVTVNPSVPQSLHQKEGKKKTKSDMKIPCQIHIIVSFHHYSKVPKAPKFSICPMKFHRHPISWPQSQAQPFAQPRHFHHVSGYNGVEGLEDAYYHITCFYESELLAETDSGT